MKGSELQQDSDPQKRASGSTGLRVGSDLLQRPEELRPGQCPDLRGAQGELRARGAGEGSDPQNGQIGELGPIRGASTRREEGSRPARSTGGARGAQTHREGEVRGWGL